jgi:ABC-type polysaccharide/polyol phosphate export permease
MVLYALKIMTGYYFPIEALDTQLPGEMSGMFKAIPLVAGVYFIRDVVIIGEDRSFMEAIRETFFPMLLGTFILAVITSIVYKYLEKKSSRWGTLEFY